MSNLEGEMFQEVCGAIGLVGLCAAAGIYPHTNSRCLSPRRVLSGNLQMALALPNPIGMFPTHCEAIAQGGALRLGAMADWSS
jgi:hypothetical protein